MSNGRYYVGRVVKAGFITQESLQEIILNPPVVEKGRFGWTITDIEDHRNESIPFIFGKLSKFSRVGQLTVVDEGTKSQRAALEPNLLEASSPFRISPTVFWNRVSTCVEWDSGRRLCSSFQSNYRSTV